MKIAYNSCFGGFTLSRKAIELGRKISGNDKWNNGSLKGDIHDSGRVTDYDYGGLANGIERCDSTLVEVVESLGTEVASGSCGRVMIAEIPDGRDYEITEYDGYEEVVPPRQSW